MKEMNASPTSPVKMIDFLLVGHVQPSVGLETLVLNGVFSNRPPQSISQLAEERYAKLKPFVQLGFKL
jgi:hypothetical protein